MHSTLYVAGAPPPLSQPPGEPSTIVAIETRTDCLVQRLAQLATLAEDIADTLQGGGGPAATRTSDSKSVAVASGLVQRIMDSQSEANDQADRMGIALERIVREVNPNLQKQPCGEVAGRVVRR